jgi:hypothetical protein
MEAIALTGALEAVKPAITKKGSLTILENVRVESNGALTHYTSDLTCRRITYHLLS